MNGECNATNVQGKNYNLHKLQGGHLPQCPIAGDTTACTFSGYIHRLCRHTVESYCVSGTYCPIVC